MRRLPSVSASQKQVWAVWVAPPVFCEIMHVTTYLNGLFKAARRLSAFSTMVACHRATLLCCSSQTGVSRQGAVCRGSGRTIT